MVEGKLWLEGVTGLSFSMLEKIESNLLRFNNMKIPTQVAEDSYFSGKVRGSNRRTEIKKFKCKILAASNKIKDQSIYINPWQGLYVQHFWQCEWIDGEHNM